jgi:hypothetical protein
MQTTRKRTAFNELSDYYEADELETCVKKAPSCRKIAHFPGTIVPKFLCWLETTVEQGCPSPFIYKCLQFRSVRRENRRCCVEANTLWRIVWRLHSAGENEKNEAAMDELRGIIRESRAVLGKKQAKAGDDEGMDDDERAVQARLVDYEA